jgi:hypothetical protein
MVLTVSFALSPEIGLGVSVAGAMRKHCRPLDVSVETSGPHDFAVRRHNIRRVLCQASIAPRANVRDDRETPLLIGHGIR